MHRDTASQIVSQIVVTPSVEHQMEQIVQELAPALHVSIYYEDFLIDHVKEVVKAAYIAESETKYIIIGSMSLNQYVQNALLKLLEEPPPHIRFILVVPSKSILLPTVLSRLPYFRVKEREEHQVFALDFSFKNFDLQALNSFLKSHERVSKRDGKLVLQALFAEATRYYPSLNHKQLEAFEKGFLLLELNGRFSTILLNVLLHFLPQKVLS